MDGTILDRKGTTPHRNQRTEPGSKRLSAESVSPSTLEFTLIPDPTITLRYVPGVAKLLRGTRAKQDNNWAATSERLRHSPTGRPREVRADTRC